MSIPFALHLASLVDFITFPPIHKSIFKLILRSQYCIILY